MEGVLGSSNKEQYSSADYSLPPGFRFHPTDEELITFYLSNKIADANFTGKAITDVDLNKCEPWDLPAKAKMGEKEWYFFNLRDRKYPTGIRTNRATNAGYWKTTGKDKEIVNTDTMELIGMKKTLVFYKGRAPRGEKTNWVMHEYRIHSKTTYRTTKDEWVVCRVFRKSSAGKKYPSQQPARTNPYSFETCSQGIVPPPMMQLNTSHFPIGRNFVSNADLAELTRVLRGSPIGNLPLPQQLNYPGSTGPTGPGCFTISGLNLNLGASLQPSFQGMGSTLFQQPVTTEASSSVLTSQGHSHGVGADTIGFGFDMNNSVVGGGNGGGGGNNMRFQNVEPCVDLEGYWPSTY